MEIIYKITEINEAVRDFWTFVRKNYPESKIFAFYGKMGSGKTTFIKHLAQYLDVIDNVVSPTFAIINEYKTKNSEFIYHFDFYRLKNLQEALDVGVQDYFYSDYYCFIEWPEIIEPILPENTIKIQIQEIDNQSRRLTIDKF